MGNAGCGTCSIHEDKKDELSIGSVNVKNSSRQHAHPQIQDPPEGMPTRCCLGHVGVDPSVRTSPPPFAQTATEEEASFDGAGAGLSRAAAPHQQRRPAGGSANHHDGGSKGSSRGGAGLGATAMVPKGSDLPLRGAIGAAPPARPRKESAQLASAQEAEVPSMSSKRHQTAHRREGVGRGGGGGEAQSAEALRQAAPAAPLTASAPQALVANNASAQCEDKRIDGALLAPPHPLARNDLSFGTPAAAARHNLGGSASTVSKETPPHTAPVLASPPAGPAPSSSVEHARPLEPTPVVLKVAAPVFGAATAPKVEASCELDAPAAEVVVARAPKEPAWWQRPSVGSWLQSAPPLVIASVSPLSEVGAAPAPPPEVWPEASLAAGTLSSAVPALGTVLCVVAVTSDEIEKWQRMPSVGTWLVQCSYFVDPAAT